MSVKSTKRVKCSSTVNGKPCLNSARAEHTCPLKSEIHDDDTTLCTCCEDCTHECAMDV